MRAQRNASLECELCNCFYAVIHETFAKRAVQEHTRNEQQCERFAFVISAYDADPPTIGSICELLLTVSAFAAHKLHNALVRLIIATALRNNEAVAEAECAPSASCVECVRPLHRADAFSR